MDARVARLSTPKECEVFAKNARSRGREDLADEAIHRAIELNAVAFGAKSDAERECLEAVYAYERILSARNSKPTKAYRTWQMIKRHGIIGAIERAVNRNDVTSGYEALRSAGLQKYAFEAVILRHPSLFTEAAVIRSRERMASYVSEP